MIKQANIQVECYSGFRADEYPKYFSWDNNRFEIYEIADRWYQVQITRHFRFATILRLRLPADKNSSLNTIFQVMNGLCAPDNYEENFYKVSHPELFKF